MKANLLLQVYISFKVHVEWHWSNTYSLTESLKALLKICFSEQGSNYRPVEEAAYIKFVDFLDDCAGMSVLESYIVTSG